MYCYSFNTKKNKTLKIERNISFEAVIQAVFDGKVLDIIVHPNKQRYPEQKIYVIDINNYVYLVPYVLDEKKKEIFFKTIFPSRKMTKHYLLKRS